MAVELVVRFELDRRAPEAAAAALAELDVPSPELAALVESALVARREERAKMARLEHLDAQLDASTGRRTRAAATGVLGLFWTLMPEVGGYFSRRMPDYPDWMMYAWSGVIVVTAGAFFVWGRESLSKTLVNRRIVATAMLAFAAQLTVELGGNLLRIPHSSIESLHMLAWGIALGHGATVEHRIWLPIVAFFAGFLGAATWPDMRWHFMSAATFVLLVTFLWSWWRPVEDQPELVRRLGEELRARRMPRGE
jgi:hypothetical protein